MECEEKAKKEAEPEATKLREEALLYWEWIAATVLRQMACIAKAIGDLSPTHS